MKPLPDTWHPDSSAGNDSPRPIGQNFAVLSAAQIMGGLFAFATAVRLARALRADGFGSVVFATNVLVYAGLIVDLGFGSMGPLEVARRDLPVPVLARTVVTTRLALTAVAAAGLGLFALVAPLDHPTTSVVLLYGLSLPLSAFDLGWVFLGLERMRPPAAAEVLQQALRCLGAFLLVSRPEHLLRVPFIFLGSRLAMALILTGAFIRRFGSLRLGIDLALLRGLLPASLKFSGGALVGTLLHNFDVVLVGLWLGNRAAGLYGAAYRVVWAPTIVANAYFAALGPALSREASRGLAAVAPLLRRSTRVSTALAIGLVTGAVLLASPIVSLLYGPEYRGAALPMQLLFVSLGLLVISRHYRSVLVAFRRPGVDLAIMASAAALNIALNVALLPRLGLPGAALAMLAAEAYILAAGSILTSRRLGSLRILPRLGRTLFSAGIMVLLLLVLRPLPLLVQIPVAGAAYLALLGALGVVKLDELRPTPEENPELRDAQG